MAEPAGNRPVAVASVLVGDQHVQFGPKIYGPGSIVAVGLDDAGAIIEVWPIVCAVALAGVGLGLFWKMLDPVGWIIGTGMLLAATALCLCSKSFIYRLTITGSDGAQHSAVSSDYLELDELRALIQRRVAPDTEVGGAEIPNTTTAPAGFSILT
jgi:hypothetical protein